MVFQTNFILLFFDFGRAEVKPAGTDSKNISDQVQNIVHGFDTRKWTEEISLSRDQFPGLINAGKRFIGQQQVRVGFIIL
jgi:hypothetical protein